ncbi:MAG: ABC transporter ATP-binding protein [Clostridiaceae bacterium]
MVEVQKLTKKYGNYIALNNINFKINQGEILGVLGPNGAGKSTLMNILTGCLSQTTGKVLVEGMDILDNPKHIKRKIGYLPEFPPLYGDMTVNEYLKFVSDIKKVHNSEGKEQLEKILQLVNIIDVRGKLIKNLSKGYKQRVAIGQALVGDPKILVLDEPTAGLELKEIIQVRDLIKDLGGKHTVILSSHILDEVNDVCDRSLIINKGEIAAQGTNGQLSKMINGGNRVMVRVKGDFKTVKRIVFNISQIDRVLDNGSNEYGTIDIIIESKKDYDIRQDIFYAFSNSNCPILMMKNEDLSLEDIFTQLLKEGAENKN